MNYYKHLNKKIPILLNNVSPAGDLLLVPLPDDADRRGRVCLAVESRGPTLPDNLVDRRHDERGRDRQDVQKDVCEDVAVFVGRVALQRERVSHLQVRERDLRSRDLHVRFPLVLLKFKEYGIT